MKATFYRHGVKDIGGDADRPDDGTDGSVSPSTDSLTNSAGFMALDVTSGLAPTNGQSLSSADIGSDSPDQFQTSAMIGSISTDQSQSPPAVVTMSTDAAQTLALPSLATSHSTVTSFASSGLVINVTYDTSVTDLATTDPTLEADFKSAVQTAVQFFESVITTPVTVKMNFGWGEFAGTPVTGLSTNKATTFNVSYNNLYTALSATDTQSDVQKAAVATLPSSDPSGGAVFKTTSAEARILGLNTFFTGTDGSIGLNSSDSYTWTGGTIAAGTFDAVGALEHEISEVLGRISLVGAGNSYMPMDLFRYTAADGKASDPLGSAAGSLNLPFEAGYNSNAFTYFSYDGKSVTLPFDTPAHVAGGADPGDWSDTVSNDSFGYASLGESLAVSPTDLQTLNVLGYNVAAAVACFAAGTRIGTIDGDVAVESLQPGAMLRSAFGGDTCAIWVGHRHIDCSRHPSPELVWPVRIAEGAFEPGRPKRDLYLSPDHAVYLRGALYPIKLLVNGSTIRQIEVASVTYYHVEVTSHDVVMAEGLPAETYLDTGNRSAFANGGAAVAMHADFSGAQAARVSGSCVPLVVAPAEVEKVWHELADRAESLGRPAFRPRLTCEPNLRLAIGDRTLRPVTIRDNCYFFVLPSGREPIFLVSHSIRPNDVRPWVDDRRCLGVMIQRLTIRNGSCHRDLAMDDPALEFGWWDVEWQGGKPSRWTNGNAELSALGSGVLEVELNGVMDYLRDAPRDSERAPAMAAAG